MNDADSAPSPRRFCNTFGICSEKAKASAATVLAPSHADSTTSRRMPEIRLSRMPAPTRIAALLLADGGEVGVGSGPAGELVSGIVRYSGACQRSRA